MIPKQIHYIWLGNNPLDKVSIMCINSWKYYLPDYEIVKWDDKNCNEIIKLNKYAHQAYKAKKYAFVSDYLRLFILFNYGGIYMDTDVKIVKSIDKFLSYQAFTSFEEYENIPTALMGAEKGNEWIGLLLKDYDNIDFVLPNGEFDFTTNVYRITQTSKKYGLIANNQEQTIYGGAKIFPKEYFCPISTRARKFDNITHNTYAMHLFNSSWKSFLRRKLSKVKKYFNISPKTFIGKLVYKKMQNMR